MAQQYKICPICDTPTHRNATLCNTCGATLANVEPVAPDSESATPNLDYNHRYGETDLSEATLRWKGGSYLLGGVVTAITLVLAAVVLSYGLRLLSSQTPSSSSTASTPMLTQADDPLTIMTNTPRATVYLPTVTQAPPSATFTETPTDTPTPGPCMQEVLEGDDLYALVYRCGHRHYEDIINQVVEINGLDDPSRIQIGQVLEIPWPTPTLDPNAIATEEVSDGASLESGASDDNINVNDSAEMADLSATLTPTLQPGVIWHRVQSGENIILIAIQYGVNVEIMSQLNPEITFSQCDFGLDAGGAACTAPIFEGQLIRVPARTPTPTLSPTPSGSETPTPTATATFNAPSALSPDNRSAFRPDELVTLRWVATGTLGPGQAYRVEVTDQTTGSYYSANTQELFFIVPEGWQGQDSVQHEYHWTVSVINTSDPSDPLYTTEARVFRWQGRGENNP